MAPPLKATTRFLKTLFSTREQRWNKLERETTAQRDEERKKCLKHLVEMGYNAQTVSSHFRDVLTWMRRNKWSKRAKKNHNGKQIGDF